MGSTTSLFHIQGPVYGGTRDSGAGAHGDFQQPPPPAREGILQGEPGFAQ